MTQHHDTPIATIARAMGLDPKSARARLRRAGIRASHVRGRAHERLVIETLRNALQAPASNDRR